MRFFKFNWRHNILLTLISVIFLGSLPIVAFIFYNMYFIQSAEEHSILLTQEDYNHVMTNKMKFVLQSTEATLKELSLNQSVYSTQDKCNAFLKKSFQPYGFSYTLFSRSTTKGIVDCSSSSMGTKPVSVGITPNIKSASKGYMGIGPVKVGPQSHELILPISYPLIKDHKINSILNTGIKISWLKKIVTMNDKIKQLWIIQKGNLLFSYPDGIPLPHCDKKNQTICSSKKWFVFYDTLKTNSMEHPLFIVTGVNKKALYAVVSKTTHLYLLLIFYVLFFSMVFYYFLTKIFLYEPLVVIEGMVRKMIKGYYTTRLPANWKKKFKSEMVHFGEKIENLAITLEKKENTIKKERENLIEMVFTDYLTKLPNRKSLDKTIDYWMKSYENFALVAIDLDGFKTINDTHGHEMGDKVLQIISLRIKNHLREDDFISRIGGDEFILLIKNAKTESDISSVLTHIGKNVLSPMSIYNHNVMVGLSAGVAFFTRDDAKNKKNDDESKLLRSADIALYESKKHKKDRFYYWTIANSKVVLKKNLFQELLHKDGLELYCQPIIDRYLTISGVEILSRLKKNDKVFGIYEFLHHLNHNDLLFMTKKIIEKSLVEIKKINDNLWFSVNIDPSFLENDNFVRDVFDLLNQYQFNPQKMHLEILEGEYIGDYEKIIGNIQKLREKGIKIYLDDIGTAHSSLMRLKKIPVDGIKLDQGFVRFLNKNPKDIVFIENTQKLAKNLGIDIVVEGVEKQEIMSALVELNIDFMQGYYISKPINLSGLKVFIEERKTFEVKESYIVLYAKQVVYHSLWDSVTSSSIIDHEIKKYNLRHKKDFVSYTLKLGLTDDSEIIRLFEDYQCLLESIMKERDEKTIDQWNTVHKNLLEKIEQHIKGV